MTTLGWETTTESVTVSLNRNPVDSSYHLSTCLLDKSITIGWQGHRAWQGCRSLCSITPKATGIKKNSDSCGLSSTKAWILDMIDSNPRRRSAMFGLVLYHG